MFHVDYLQEYETQDKLLSLEVDEDHVDNVFLENKRSYALALAGKTNEKVVLAPNKKNEPLVGSKLKLWKQDSIDKVSTIFVPRKVSSGPSDEQIKVVPPKGMREVQTDDNGDFIVSPDENLAHFEMVHCYSVVRIVLNLYERFLKATDPKAKLKWAWTTPSYIKVIPRAGLEANAYYSRDDKAIQLYYYKSGRKTYYTNHSFDIIAHECGHAVLDGLKPKWMNANTNETIAAHETFADMTVVFALLTQMDVIEILLAETKGNIHKDNFISQIAETFGQTMTNSASLRNCNNQLRMDQVSKEPHELSQVMTGCVYDILATILTLYLQPEFFDTAESFFRVAKWVRQMFMHGYMSAPDNKVTFRQLGNGFLDYATKDNWATEWRQAIIDALTNRKIL